MMSATEKKQRGPIAKFLWSMVPWLIGGFIFGVSLSLSQDLFGWDIDEVFGQMSNESAFSDSSSGVALVLGAMLFIAGAVTGAGALSPGAGVKLKLFEDRSDWPQERGLYGYSSMGCMAWGAILILLALSKPLGIADSALLLLALVVATALIVLSFWRLLVEFDELWHDINRISCEFAFYGTLLIGGVWSGLAHLEIATALSPLGWICLMTALSLIGATVGNGMRGTLNK